MKTILFVLCVLAVTVYLTVAAIEDYRTCEVTRWKHLIGLISASISIISNMKIHSMIDFAIILAFSVIFMWIGLAGVYGMADGFVLANLTLYFGSIAGDMGAGIVIIILVIAAFSFLICHIGKCLIYKEEINKNIKGALIPHILVGYVAVMILVLVNAV